MEHDECPHCFEDVLVQEVTTNAGKRIKVLLQPEEVELIDNDGYRSRGHERHWKYCSARPTTGSESARPPDELHDDPDSRHHIPGEAAE